MSGRVAAAAFVAAFLGLLGSVSAILVLHRAASRSVERLLEERLSTAGRSAALLLGDTPPTAPLLLRLRDENALEDAYVLDGALTVLASADGSPPRPADLLRVDPELARAALNGASRVGHGYGLGELTVLVGYFPLGTAPRQVLALEAGEAFAAAREGPRRALLGGLSLAGLGAAALGAAALAWARAERQRQEIATRSARAEAVTRMAAIAAHEIRNPLAVIRGTAELLKTRLGAEADPRLRGGLEDVIAETVQLSRLTEDLLHLSSDRPLQLSPVDLSALVAEVARSARSAFPEVELAVHAPGAPLWVEADAGRLRQALGNLVQNAAQAARRVAVSLRAEPGAGVVEVSDDGPGVPPEVQARLFEPFFTTRANGTGLGLALSRRFIERQGGTLRHLPSEKGGATFEVRVPSSDRREG